MKYLWTEDTGAGLHFWKLVNQLFFDDTLVVESKGSNQGLLNALSDIDMKENDKYYIAFDYVVDNQDIRNKYRLLKSIAEKSNGRIIILDMICFEYLILAFDYLVPWTGSGKKDKIRIREAVLSAIEDHRINLSKIDDVKTLQYLAGFKRYSTERVMKSLVGEFTQNEKWSVKGSLMGECWYKDCCVSEHPDNLRCGTSSEHERFGADAIHYKIQDAKNIIILGEAKTYSSNYKFATAFSDALNSIVNTYKEHRRELNLYVHEDFLDNEMNQVAEDYLNNTLENVEVHLVSIITYNENKKLEFDTETGIKNQIETIIAERYHLFDNNKIDIENNPILRRITYIVFPVWDLKGLVEEFQKMI